MPNFSSLAGLEVSERFVVGWWWVGHLATLSNLNASCLELLLVKLR